MAEAAGWLRDAFRLGACLRTGAHRAQLVHGDGAVIVTLGTAWCPGHVRVDDGGAGSARVVAAAALIASHPSTHPYSERQRRAEDPARHRWTFSEWIADVDPEDWGGTLVDEQPLSPEGAASHSRSPGRGAWRA